MIKKLLKNKFFILLIGVVTISIMAKFSVSYALNNRLIALSIGIEKNNENFVVILEVITPKKDDVEYISIKGEGVTIESAIASIEKTSGAKVSLAQCEIIFVETEVFIDDKIDFLGSKSLKDIPEIAVCIAVDKPSEIIGKKIGDKNLSSHELGSIIRQSEDITQQEINHKDIGKNYLSYKNIVVLPYIASSVDNNNVKLSLVGGLAFDKKNHTILPYDEYLGYLILQSGKNKGTISIKKDNNLAISLTLEGIEIKSTHDIVNGKYISKYDVKVVYNDDKSRIVLLDNEINKRIRIDDTNKNEVVNAIKSSIEALLVRCKTKGLDILNDYKYYYRQHPEMLANEDKFVDKVEIDIKVDLVSNLA